MAQDPTQTNSDEEQTALGALVGRHFSDAEKRLMAAAILELADKLSPPGDADADHLAPADAEPPAKSSTSKAEVPQPSEASQSLEAPEPEPKAPSTTAADAPKTDAPTVIEAPDEDNAKAEHEALQALKSKKKKKGTPKKTIAQAGNELTEATA